MSLHVRTEGREFVYCRGNVQHAQCRLHPMHCVIISNCLLVFFYILLRFITFLGILNDKCWCFVFRFFTLLGVYLILGVAVQRFYRGARGWQQIPNYSYWQTLGNYAAVNFTKTQFKFSQIREILSICVFSRF